MPPSDLKIKVELKQHNIRWSMWMAVADAFGVCSPISRLVWWFLKPLDVNVAGDGWKSVNVCEWFEIEI